MIFFKKSNILYFLFFYIFQVKIWLQNTKKLSFACHKNSNKMKTATFWGLKLSFLVQKYFFSAKYYQFELHRLTGILNILNLSPKIEFFIA